MIIVCALLAEEFMKKQIPVIDRLDKDPLRTIRTGDIVRVNEDTGCVEIVREKPEPISDGLIRG